MTRNEYLYKENVRRLNFLLLQQNGNERLEQEIQRLKLSIENYERIKNV